MNKKILKLISIFLCLTMTLTSTGCFSKKKKEAETVAAEENSISYEEELRNTIEAEYADLYASKDQELQSIKDQLALYDGKYKTSDSFKKKTIAQAGNIEFYKVKDKIILDRKVINSAVGSSAGFDSSISVGKFTISPTNWNVNLNASKLNLSLNNTAYGDINFYTPSSKKITNSSLVGLVTKVFEENNMDEISSRGIFLDNKEIGYESIAKIMIKDTTTNGSTLTVPALSILDSSQMEEYGIDKDGDVSITLNIDENDKDAYFRLGLLYTGGTMIQYNFIYTSENGSILVDNVINSIKQGNKSIYLN